MKKGIIIIIAALLVLAFAACSPAGTANPVQNGQRADDGSIRGIVTAVSTGLDRDRKNGRRQPPGRSAVGFTGPKPEPAAAD